MKKHIKIITSVFMAGIMGVTPYYADGASYAENNVVLDKSQDGTSYEAVYTFDTSDIPTGKRLTLIPDSTDKIGDADLSVSISKSNSIEKDEDVEITFSSTGFTAAGDYTAVKNINGYLEDDYTADDVPVLKDFLYDIDGTTVTLTKYTGTNTEVVIYPEYHIDNLNSPVYSTIIGVTRYDTVIIGGYGDDFVDEEYVGTDPNYTEYTIEEGVFANNTSITSVTFLDGVRIGSQNDYMVQSDNIYALDENGNLSYHGYRFGGSYADGERYLTAYLDEVDSHGNAVYKDIDGIGTVVGIYGPDMKGMFTGCTALKEVKNIPDDVVKMTNTFRGCRALTRVTNLPSELLDMEKTFMDCESLVDVPQIPENVVNMLATFRDCKNLNPTITLRIPETVRNFMETFENCNVMEKTPIVSSKMRVRNLYYTFYRCKKLEELPVLPENVVSMFRTFYGCESATGIINDTPHVIGNNKTDTPIDLIDTYRGCKLLNADIYIDMDKDFANSYVTDDDAGYSIGYQISGGSTQYARKSYEELFSDNTWRYNCYDYNKLWENKKDEAISKAVADPDADIWYVYKMGVNSDKIDYWYRRQTPKGMFWEAALGNDAQIRLHLTDNSGFATNEFNFKNASCSVLGALGADGATGTTIMNVDRYAALPVLEDDEDDREYEEINTAVWFDEEYRVYTFNLSYHIENNEEKLEAIEITTPPDKVDYKEGESFDRTGMKVTAIYRLYTDGTATNTYRRTEVTEYTTDKGILSLSDDKVVVTYQGKTADQSVTVTRKTVAVEGILKDASNNPLVGYKVELHSDPKTTVTDSDGKYRFENVETGEHTLYVYDTNDREYGTVSIVADAGSSSAVAGNTDNMDFNISVSKNDSGDIIQVNGALKLNQSSTNPTQAETRPPQPSTNPSESESKTGSPANPSESESETASAANPSESESKTGSPANPSESESETGSPTKPSESENGTASAANPSESEGRPEADSGTESGNDDKDMFNIDIRVYLNNAPVSQVTWIDGVPAASVDGRTQTHLVLEGKHDAAVYEVDSNYNVKFTINNGIPVKTGGNLDMNYSVQGDTLYVTISRAHEDENQTLQAADLAQTPNTGDMGGQYNIIILFALSLMIMCGCLVQKPRKNR